MYSIVYLQKSSIFNPLILCYMRRILTIIFLKYLGVFVFLIYPYRKNKLNAKSALVYFLDMHIIKKVTCVSKRLLTKLTPVSTWSLLSIFFLVIMLLNIVSITTSAL